MTQLFTEMPPLSGAESHPALREPQPRRWNTVALVSKDNGAGLRVDMDLLEIFLTDVGYSVTRVDWRRSAMPPVDVVIFVELFNHQLVKYAQRSVGIFNPEWFLPNWKRHIRHLNQIWCKSHEAVGVFSRYNRMSYYTGFISRYLADDAVKKERSCVHLQGRSALKNTEAVLEAWRRYPDLPPLTVITSKTSTVPPHVQLLGNIPGDELVKQLNTHRFHVCPSRAEGWGHYITEGLSTGAYVITTDASPMNEHVRQEWGALIPPSGAGRRYEVKEYVVDPESIASAVREASILSDAELDKRGKRARDYFLIRNQDFRTAAQRLLEIL